MAENSSSRSSPPEEEAGQDRGPGRGARTSPYPCEEVIRDLPDRFRSAGARLARELYGAPGDLRVETADDPDSGAPPWHAGLELEEAWAVAQSFRRAMRRTDTVTGRHREPDEFAALDAALDRTLLGAARAALDRNSEAHRRMVQDVSHDLRSPLNSILFLADALRSERSGPLTTAQSHQMSILYMAAVTLVGMVNDLIDFARLSVGRERIAVTEAPFSLETVIADVRSLVGPLTTHRGTELRTVLDSEGLRHGDQRLLSRVLLNLVSNALEAVEKGGTVTLTFTDTDEGDLRIEVSDDRCGTDVKALRQLLSISDDRWPGETRGWTRGLGLTISARFVQAAGGRIEVLSPAGQGTVFRVELPFGRL